MVWPFPREHWTAMPGATSGAGGAREEDLLAPMRGERLPEPVLEVPLMEPVLEELLLGEQPMLPSRHHPARSRLQYWRASLAHLVPSEVCWAAG